MNQRLWLILSIALGGAIGALLRYWSSGMVYKYVTSIFPWGTLAVNLLGAFILGFLWNIFNYYVIPAHFKIFITIGVLGAFTTFSTYALETINLFRDGELLFGLLNIALNNVLGLILVFAGLIISRTLLYLFT